MKEYIERAEALDICQKEFCGRNMRCMMIAMSWLQEGVGTLYLLSPPPTLRR